MVKRICAEVERIWQRGRERRFFFGCCLACFMTLMLYFFFVHLPLQEQCTSYEKRQVELHGRLADVMNFKNVHGDLASYAKELSDREVRAQRVLPLNLAQGDFLQELQHKALQSQVKLQKVAPAEVHKAEDVQQMPVSVSCSGSYFAVLDFLRRLQQSERLLAIRETKLEQQKDGVLQCQLLVTAYAWARDEGEGENALSRGQ